MAAYRDMLREHLLPLSVLFLFFLIHFYFLNRYGINIPFSDDYGEIFKKMNMILDSGTITESAGHLFNGNGYSKPITLRFISLLHLSVLHEINFKYLVITGNIFLLLTCFVFIASAANINKYLTITVSCFVFQPQYWEAIYQSTLSNSVFSCLFFSLASMYCIMQKKTKYYVGSLMFAVLAQISFGNGFLVYPILLMISILQKNFRLFAVIFTIMILSTYLYMIGDSTSYNAGEQIEILTKLKLWSVWFLEFLGSSVGYVFSSGYERDIIGKTASITIGFLILIFYILLIKQKYYDKNLLLFSFYTFFILTALMVTKIRFIVEVPGASRYQIQSALCILTSLIVIVDLYAANMNKYIVIMLTVVFPLLFVYTSYRTNLPTVSWHKRRLATGLWSWIDNGKGLTIWSGEDAAGRLIIQSINKNIYKIPPRQSLIMESWKQ